MSASPRQVPAVPISDPASFDPFSAPEGWFSTPRRFFLLFTKDKKTGESRLMPGNGQLQFMLVLENELWGDRREANGKPTKTRSKPTDRQRKPLPPPDPWSRPLSLLYLARKACISVAQLQEIIADAVGRGLIEKCRRRGERESRFRLAVENWASAPFYKPQGIAAADVTEDLTDEETAKQDAGPPASSSRVTAGRTSTFEIAETGHKIRAKNRFDVDIEVAVKHLAEKLIEVEFSPPLEKPAEVIAFPPGASTGANHSTHSSRPPGGQETAAAEDPAAVLKTDLRDFLLPRFTARDAALDTPTVRKMAKAIEKSGSSVDHYKQLVLAREARGGRITPGAYVKIATVDLAVWAKQQREVQAKGLKVEAPKKPKAKGIDWDAL